MYIYIYIYIYNTVTIYMCILQYNMLPKKHYIIKSIRLFYSIPILT